MGHKDIATAHVVPYLYGRKKREADGYLGWGGYHGAYAGLPYGAYGYAHSAYPYALSSAVKSVEVQPATVEVKSTPIVHAAPALALYGRKKREADPVYFSNVKAEVTEHEGKYTVPVATYAHGYWPYGLVPAVGTAEVPYKYNTVAYKSAPVENPSDPTRPELIHTSKLGICLNVYGLQVPC